MLDHDDKDRDVWLKSKGSLSVEEQQFGHWLKAPQFSPARRQTMEVKGYDVGNPKPCPKARQTTEGAQLVFYDNPPQQSKIAPSASRATAETRGKQSQDLWSLDMVNSAIAAITNSKQYNHDFEAMLEDID